MIAVAVCGAALAGCSDLPGLWSSERPKLTFQSNPSGAEATLSSGSGSCKTPCSVPTSAKSGNYNATFTLAGYTPQTVPIRVTVGKENWYSSEIVEVSPNPVTAVLEPEKPVAPSRRR